MYIFDTIFKRRCTVIVFLRCIKNFILFQQFFICLYEIFKLFLCYYTFVFFICFSYCFFPYWVFSLCISVYALLQRYEEIFCFNLIFWSIFIRMRSFSVVPFGYDSIVIFQFFWIEVHVINDNIVAI